MQEDPTELPSPGKSAGIAIGMEVEFWQRGKARKVLERVSPKATCILGKMWKSPNAFRGTNYSTGVKWRLKITNSDVVSKISCLVCILCIFDSI